jgi:hypothetical protein
MAVAEINNLIIYKGTDFEATFNLFEADSSAVTLNYLGASYARVRKFPTSIAYEDFAISITTSTGTIKLTLTAEKTSRLTVGRNYFDVILTISSKKVPMLRGTIIVEESNSL